MAFRLSEGDHDSMDRLLEAILKSYASGDCTLVDARSTLAQVMTAAVIDNEGEFKAWCSPEGLAEWSRSRGDG